jgi:hypothetical protein
MANKREDVSCLEEGRIFVAIPLRRNMPHLVSEPGVQDRRTGTLGNVNEDRAIAAELSGDEPLGRWSEESRETCHGGSAMGCRWVVVPA